MEKIPVMILCGGMGTRLREETEVRPKPMVEIGGRPMLWHIMKLYSSYGFKEFVLCLGYKGHVIKEYFLNYKTYSTDLTMQLGRPESIQYHNSHAEEDWHVTLVETGQTAQTGSRVARGGRYIKGETFCLTYGDGLGDIDLAALIDFHRKHGKIATITGLVASMDADPSVSVTFAMTAGSEPTTFNIFTTEIMFPDIVDGQAFAFATLVLTDEDGDGATMTGLFSDDKAYQARYNNGQVFTELLAPLIADPDDFAFTGGRVPDSGRDPVTGAVTSIIAEYKFTLSPNDTAVGSSRFDIVPEPATIALLGLGGAVMLVLRRERR